MATAISRPAAASGTGAARGVDDVRALRFRVRTLSFSGNYATGGETITAASVGLKQIIGVIQLDTLVRAAAGVTGVFPVFDVASDRKSVVIRMIEDVAGASGTPFGLEKTNAEAYIASSKIDILFIGS